MDWLKELLKNAGIEDTKVDEIVGNVNKEIPKYLIPKDKYNEVAESKKDLETQLNTANTTIADLKEGNKDNEALQATIKTHETTIATMKTDYENKIREMSIQSAIRSKLTDTKYPELLETKFDKTKLSVSEDGTVLGVEEQLTAIKEQYKDLFVPTVTGRDPNNSGGSSLGKGKKAELEALINDPNTKLAERIAAKNQLFKLNESEE